MHRAEIKCCNGLSTDRSQNAIGVGVYLDYGLQMLLYSSVHDRLACQSLSHLEIEMFGIEIDLEQNCVVFGNAIDQLVEALVRNQLAFFEAQMGEFVVLAEGRG